MRRSWRRLPAIVATLLAVGMLACKDGGPTAGTLSVELATVNTDDGAVWVRLVGDGISSPEAVSGYRMLSKQSTANELDAIVVGDIVQGNLLRFRVPDVDREYSAVVIEVARRDNTLRDPPTGYSVEVHK